MFTEPDELLLAIEEIVSGIEKTTWIAVFQDLMRRLQIYIDTQGEYII
jgi:hypothetical protein